MSGMAGLRACAVAVALAGAPLALPAAAAAQALDGTFLFLGAGAATPALSEAELAPYFKELAALRMSTVIIAATRQQTGAGCGNGPFEWLPHMPGKLDHILDLAQASGMQVWVGLTLSHGCAEFAKPAHIAALSADTRLAMEALMAAGGTHPALAGFYIPDEPGLAWDSFQPYYKALVGVIRAFSAKPIAVAPYLAKVNLPPAEVAAMALRFKQGTGVDLQIWQDSTGADSIPLGTFGRTATVEDYFKALSGALGPEGLWADVELFNGPLATFTGPAYRPASISRINRQLFETRSQYAAKRVTWIQQLHMGTIDRNRYPEADRLHAAYKALYGMGGQYLRAASYKWDTAPAALYGDQGGELVDMRTGDPKVFTHAGWVGVLGDASVTLDLGSRQRVDWVAAHVLNDGGPGVFVPARLTLQCADEDAAFRVLGAWPRPFEATPDRGEYVFGNDAPLGAACRYVRVMLANSAWTFVSEIEIVGAPLAAQGILGATGVQPTPAPATDPAVVNQPARALPGVIVTVAGQDYPGGAGTPANHPKSVAAGGGFAVGIRPAAALAGGEVCRLDRSRGAVAGALYYRPETTTFPQLDLVADGAAGGETYCGYCYRSMPVYEQSGVCVTVSFP